MSRPRKGFVNILQEFSLPLIAGVVCALVAANLAPETYEYLLGEGHDQEHWLPFGHLKLFGHELTAHYLINDIFMVFFFGIAAKEITEACLPGGDLNPLRRAVNPLLATLGGVLGPVGIFFLALWLSYQIGIYPPDADWSAQARGWGVPTATDIALAWLVARTVFGRGHPAINFLLLLAVADDAIGLVIIAVFYGDPHQPAEPAFLSLILVGMAAVFAMRKVGVKSWIPYIGIGGPLAWTGLTLTHLHPALALVFIVPFMPGPRRDIALFVDADEVDRMGDAVAQDLDIEHSALHLFEKRMKTFVDFGLFFFALANAGVALGGIGPLTWVVLASLVIGKTLGITAFGLLAIRIGFPLPRRMSRRDLVMASFVAALGLTVALFMAGAAYPDPALQGQAKMGALFSGLVGFVALLLGRSLGFGRAESTDGG